MKKHYGWNINHIELDIDKSKEGSEITKLAKEIKEQERINTIMSASLIDKEEYGLLRMEKDRFPITNFYFATMRRYEI